MTTTSEENFKVVGKLSDRSDLSDVGVTALVWVVFLVGLKLISV